MPVETPFSSSIEMTAMPAKTKRQRRAAGAELARRKKGKRGGKSRPFGTAPTKTVRKSARKRR